MSSHLSASTASSLSAPKALGMAWSMEERMGISHSGASGFWSRYEKEGEKRQKSDVTKANEPHLEGTPRDQGVVPVLPSDCCAAEQTHSTLSADVTGKSCFLSAWGERAPVLG